MERRGEEGGLKFSIHGYLNRLSNGGVHRTGRMQEQDEDSSAGRLSVQDRWKDGSIVDDDLFASDSS